MLCGGLGSRLFVCSSHMELVFVGAGGTVRRRLSLKAGKLQNATAENSCSEHGMRSITSTET